MSSSARQVLTAAELAERLGVKRASVVRWARDGRIPSHRVGSHVWFVLAEVNDFTYQAATVRPVVAPLEPPSGASQELNPRLFEIVGQSARGDGRAVAGAGRRRKRTG